MAVTPAATAATTGFVVPGLGVYGGVNTSTANLLSVVDEHHANRNGLKMDIFYFSSVGNTNVWTSNIPGIVAVAWQGADADDEACVPFLSMAASGAVTFQMQNSYSEGWLWILHSS